MRIFSYITEVMTKTYFFQIFVTHFGIIYDNCANLILCNSLDIADDTKLYYGNKKKSTNFFNRRFLWRRNEILYI